MNRDLRSALENIIFDTHRIDVSLKVFPDRISIRSKDYGEYCLAKSAIRGMVSKPVVRDSVNLEVVK